MSSQTCSLSQWFSWPSRSEHGSRWASVRVFIVDNRNTILRGLQLLLSGLQAAVQNDACGWGTHLNASGAVLRQATVYTGIGIKERCGCGVGTAETGAYKMDRPGSVLIWWRKTNINIELVTRLDKVDYEMGTKESQVPYRQIPFNKTPAVTQILLEWLSEWWRIVYTG
ncbi:hypothetical protein BDQ12DRAFT_668953 [Crucibulum laeve]|uniref:Uncharacterized protein n=1 Tax=Crucibulum laeve TaxID=68775 RepID=A0A5C3LP67_9AGAR|nr:hypothetical protein BDQ12DRAFT_668953 [Crucibulum laeve]